jgi:hypothetical protein
MRVLYDSFRPPFRRFVIRARLPVELVVSRIEHATAPRWSPGSFFSGRPLRGSISLDGFKVERKRNWFNNWCLAVSIGRFESTAHGTRIMVAMRMNWFQIVFLAWWLGICGLGEILSLSSAVFKTNHHRVPSLRDQFLLVFFALGYSFFAVPFACEARKARRLLVRSLRANRPAGLASARQEGSI